MKADCATHLLSLFADDLKCQRAFLEKQDTAIAHDYISGELKRLQRRLGYEDAIIGEKSLSIISDGAISSLILASVMAFDAYHGSGAEGWPDIPKHLQATGLFLRTVQLGGEKSVPLWSDDAGWLVGRMGWTGKSVAIVLATVPIVIAKTSEDGADLEMAARERLLTVFGD